MKSSEGRGGGVRAGGGDFIHLVANRHGWLVMPAVTEAVYHTEILQRIMNLGIWRPVGDQRGVYVGDAKPGEIERVEQLLIERRARMFKS